MAPSSRIRRYAAPGRRPAVSERGAMVQKTVEADSLREIDEIYCGYEMNPSDDRFRAQYARNCM